MCAGIRARAAGKISDRLRPGRIVPFQQKSISKRGNHLLPGGRFRTRRQGRKGYYPYPPLNEFHQDRLRMARITRRRVGQKEDQFGGFLPPGELGELRKGFVQGLGVVATADGLEGADKMQGGLRFFRKRGRLEYEPLSVIAKYESRGAQAFV